MNDRIHACLDGVIPRSALSGEEQIRLVEIEAITGAVAGHLRAQEAPDLVDAVMGRLPPAPAPLPVRSAFPSWRQMFGWLWAPRPIRLVLRPVYAIGGLLLLLGLVVPLARLMAPGASELAEADGRAHVASPVYVQFRLEAPAASRVELVGSFTDWKPSYELRETSPGVWSVLVPIEPGVHDYGFMVDGERWVTDPHAPQVDDSFGGTNSRLSLPPPQGAV